MVGWLGGIGSWHLLFASPKPRCHSHLYLSQRHGVKLYEMTTPTVCSPPSNSIDVMSPPGPGEDPEVSKTETDMEGVGGVLTSQTCPEPYTVFKPSQKLSINLIISFAAMFSTMSSFVYLPALVPISADLNVSLFLINLSVTSYLVIAGVAPAFMGDMAEQNGRRPVYVLMFSLMIAASIGMALQTSFPALLFLRMVQSAGSSGSSPIISRDQTSAKRFGGHRTIRDCIWSHC